ncbi:MAG: hypothetical protein ACQXXH_02150 [Candidatus Bathyarchaeia archaeon]|jgi:hypothetical protein|nr:hypothetical protein [Candidatus Bathyarchaeota archaeon A05DMB-4]MDH7594546.1 hypothetical protein [Candidatus Bathyarchaeota archaeon]
MIDRKEKEAKREAEEVKEILSAVSTEIPALIKSIVASVFSEEAGKSMGKAAAAYYKELKDGGLPESVAVKLTEDYMRTFTSFGDLLRSVGRKEDKLSERIEEEVHKRLEEKIGKKLREAESDEEEE